MKKNIASLIRRHHPHFRFDGSIGNGWRLRFLLHQTWLLFLRIPAKLIRSRNLMSAEATVVETSDSTKFKTILISAYAVNPFSGSADAMGWNMLLQAARFNKVIAVTRKNNRDAISKYNAMDPEEKELLQRIQWLYFDGPSWLVKWGKGPLLSMIYYYCWQLSLVLWLRGRRLKMDIVHNLNFHNDWTPTFLWMLGKPMVWGYVGHHPYIPKNFLLPVYGWKAYLQDRALWMLKQFFWNADPFLWLAKRKASSIICMNSEAAKKMKLKDHFVVHPAVATQQVIHKDVEKENFRVLSVGRFVPLKGFDLTIRSFAVFYHGLPITHQRKVQLVLIGTGPQKDFLISLVKESGIEQAVTFIEWLPKNKMPAYYKLSSLFLFPSHEGASMVVPEAMSYNLPVVCMKNCGPGELISPQSELAVPYGNYEETVKSLASKIYDLYAKPSFLNHERALAKERYWQMFRWDVRGEMLKTVYENVMNNVKTA